MNNQNKALYIIATSILCCLVMYIIEQVIGLGYVAKTASKIILFTSVPLLYTALWFKRKQSPKNAGKVGGRKRVVLGVLAGAASFLTVMAAFVVLRGFIDLQGITLELSEKSGITSENFYLIGAYITFGNSFLEEFFFRGFIFLNLHNLGFKRLSYVFSSLLFAIYHIAIFETWFSLPLLLLALFGLALIGFILDWLDTKSDSILNSWITHILADCSIMVIGLAMFGII